MAEVTTPFLDEFGFLGVDFKLQDTQAREDIAVIKPTLAKKANVDGFYPDIYAGTAGQLLSDVIQEDKVPYVFRHAGGSLEIGDRAIDEMIGGSLNWNQLFAESNIQNIPTETAGISRTRSTSGNVVSVNVAGTPTATQNYTMASVPESVFKTDHVYLFDLHANLPAGCRISPGGTYDQKSYVLFKASPASNRSIAITMTEGMAVDFTIYPNAHDITALLGPTLADYINTLETATVGAGLARLKSWGLFQKDYYPYKAVTMEHMQVSAHETVEFNQWDEEWETGGIEVTNGNLWTDSSRVRPKNFIPCLPDTIYAYSCNTGTYTGNLAIIFYDAEKNYISFYDFSTVHRFTTPSNCHYLKFQTGEAYGGTYHNDICVYIHWDDTRNGEYKAYKKNTYTLDPIVLRGIPKKDENGNLYFDGDIYKSDGTVERRYAEVDLGSLTWQANNQGQFFTSIASAGRAITNFNQKISSAKYTVSGQAYNGTADFRVQARDNNVWLMDTAFGTDAAALKASLSGVYFIYELETPTTEEAAPFTNPQTVDNWGTERYVDYAYEEDNRDFEFPAGHRTEYGLDIKSKVESAPESPTVDGMYIMQRINGVNYYAPLIVEDELPEAPSTNGTYSLKVTVADGASTLSWAAD